ncbi:TonB-dependent receptor [Chitinophaga sp. Mgbs1]|uniref:TonB-dependent receptor n=1 Tax=Chitinophaga solisilvae TaxID=1233460 RepID=A0A433WM49_9BACT|nr:TonB-dependent receptor [Chitinophaga solisilvae]
MRFKRSILSCMAVLPLAVLAQEKDSLRHRRELQEIVIAGKQDGYKQDISSLATRSPLSLLETPQAIQVAGQQVIRDKQAFTLNDLTPVLTGVKANNGMGAFGMRGFNGYNHFDGGFITFNGIRGNFYMWNQAPLLYNIERVEVLRGPASALFSEGSPGGLINMVTKKPQAGRQLSIDAAWGSWNYARFAIDATGTLSGNKRWLYRAIGGYDRSNSYRDNQFAENIFLAPSVTWLASAKTDVNLELNYSRSNAVQTYDRGTFVKKRTDGTYDFDFYPGNLTVQSPSDFGRNTNTSATLTFNHRVNDRLSFAVVQRLVRSQLNFADHFLKGEIVDDKIKRSYQTWDYVQFSAQTTAYAHYRLQTGSVQHNLLAGIDYNRYGWSKNLYRDAASTTMDIFRPDYSNDVPAPDPSDYYDDNKQANTLAGGYIQDQINILKQLKVLLSLRYDHYKLLQTPMSAKDDLQGDTSRTSAWTPRAGIVYMPAPHMAVYASYTRSFNPQLSNAGSRGGPFPPRTATQYEIGYKGDFFGEKLSVMAALYHINYTNILADAGIPESPRQQTIVPGTRSRGAEVTLQGNLRNLSIVAGYAYNQHRLTRNSSIGKEGDRYVNAPDHNANIWAKYQFSRTRLKGLGIAAGGRYISSQVGNMKTQDFIIPSSVVLDAALSYAYSRYNFQFNLNNLTNTRYFNGGLSRTAVAALGNPLNFRLGVNVLIL